MSAALTGDLDAIVSCYTKAPARILLTAVLVKTYIPSIDIRKPFKEKKKGKEKKKKGELNLFVKGSEDDSYSGRSYDEDFITDFIYVNKLNLIKTTGFLTPAFRAKGGVLTPDTELNGKPANIYRIVLNIINAVHVGDVGADEVLLEMLRLLILQRNRNKEEIDSKLQKLKQVEAGSFIPLSSEHIIKLISGQFDISGASRLPVLLIAAAYSSVEGKLGEKVMALNAHNAADSQTGSLGDVEVTMCTDDNIVTVYEMKLKRVLETDIQGALVKLIDKPHVDNYIFITTDPIDPVVQDAARDLYNTYGTEFVILDCIGFMRHFLHLFHRHRIDFLDAYQQLILDEPLSDVPQEQKELWLAARIAAESRNNQEYARRQA